MREKLRTNFLMGKLCMAKDGMEENTHYEIQPSFVWPSSKLKWPITKIKVGKQEKGIRKG